MSMLSANILAVLCAISVLGATPEQEKAQGEQMLQKARQELVQARSLHEGAARMLLAAHKEQEMADQRTHEARASMREAYLLLGDANRMRATEIRAAAETKELQAQMEEVELQHLKAVAAQEKKSADDSAKAVLQIQDAAKNETNPARKEQLVKMAESVANEGASASAELALIEKRIAALEAEINRLKTKANTLNAEAGAIPATKK